MHTKLIKLGKFSEKQLDGLMRESLQISNPGERIDFLSRKFLDTDYAEATLVGDKDIPEVFVINLAEVDCMTFIEYIEAMRLSGSYQEFESNLRRVRYRSGIVQFVNRNHFFSDWKEFNSGFVDDVTETIGGDKTIRIRKILNKKEDGTCFLPGVQSVEREILYIPFEAVDTLVLRKLITGDYIGIYSALNGLDVSHVGIIIRVGGTLYLRHASSQKGYRRVIDQDFKTYISDTSAIMVFRPKM